MNRYRPFHFAPLAPMVWILVFNILPASPGHCETIRSEVIMAGTRYATTYYVKAGDKPGPTVVVIGGVHGDEVAGYRAAEQLVNWKITQGTLLVLPDAHKEAIRRNVRAYPGNMNNMFPGKADGDDMERLAYQIFEVIRNAHPKLLLTLHESREFHSENPARYGQTFCYDFTEINSAMQPALESVNSGINRKRDKFSLFVEPHRTCPTYQAWVQLKTPATSIETCRELPLSVRIKYQLMAVSAFFDEMHLGYERQERPSLAPSEEPATQVEPSIGLSPALETDPVTVPPPSNGTKSTSSDRPQKPSSFRNRHLSQTPVVKVADSLELRVTDNQAPAHERLAWLSLLGLSLALVVFCCAVGSFTFHSLSLKKKK